MKSVAFAPFLVLGVLASSVVGCAATSVADDPSGDLGSSETASALSSSSNEHTAYRFFVSKGLSHIQSAAIVGNLMQESSVDPSSVQSGGPGRGIAQWSVGARWDRTSNDNVAWYARTHGGSQKSVTTQLEFLWYELQTFPTYGFSRLRSASTLTSAVSAFQSDYEVCGACNQSRRLRDAQQVLNAFGKEAVTTLPPTTVPSTSTPSAPSDSSAASGPAGCFSSTLGKEMSADACVQSQADGLWYQCDDGSWVPRQSDPNACQGEHPL